MSAGKTTARDALLRLTNPRLMWGGSRRKERPIKRIVVIRPDHLGDLLFATPALRVIREAYPDAHITGLVGPWGRAMWQGNPDLDAVEVLRFPGMGGHREGWLLAPYMLLRHEASRIERGDYDLGIVMRFDHWWGAALMAAARIPHRWGYDTPGMKEWLSDAVPYVTGRHEVEQNVTLVDAVLTGMGVAHTSLKVDRAKGVPALLPPEEEKPRPDILGGWIDAPRRAIIHPGTMAANKLWTIKGWATVAGRLAEEGWQIAITGTVQEKPLADAIVREISSKKSVVRNLAGQTANLGQLVWLLKRADLVLGVDNGPLHLASALAVPNVRLYGPSNERIWGPWGDGRINRVVRAPGTHASQHLDVGSKELEGGAEMRAITVEMVMGVVGSR